MIFIDGSNLYHILKNLCLYGKKLQKEFPYDNLDFKLFIKKLCCGKERKLIRTYYYNARLDQNYNKKTYSEQQKFFERLKTIPDFEVVLCRLQKDLIDGEIRYFVKEDDIHLAVDMLKLAFVNAYDTAILVSSDGDFVPAVDAVKELGKKVENIGFPNKFSWHLKNKCDRFRILTEEELLECAPVD